MDGRDSSLTSSLGDFFLNGDLARLIAVTKRLVLSLVSFDRCVRGNRHCRLVANQRSLAVKCMLASAGKACELERDGSDA